MMLVHPAGNRLPVSLQLTDTNPKEPVRVHLDLYTPTGTTTARGPSNWHATTAARHRPACRAHRLRRTGQPVPDHRH
jgi:hypothetical protein